MRKNPHCAKWILAQCAEKEWKITQLTVKNALSGCINDAQELREVWHVWIILNANVVEEM